MGSIKRDSISHPHDIVIDRGRSATEEKTFQEILGRLRTHHVDQRRHRMKMEMRVDTEGYGAFR